MKEIEEIPLYGCMEPQWAEYPLNRQWLFWPTWLSPCYGCGELVKQNACDFEYGTCLPYHDGCAGYPYCSCWPPHKGDCTPETLRRR